MRRHREKVCDALEDFLCELRQEVERLWRAERVEVELDDWILNPLFPYLLRTTGKKSGYVRELLTLLNRPLTSETVHQRREEILTIGRAWKVAKSVPGHFLKYSEWANLFEPDRGSWLLINPIKISEIVQKLYPPEPATSVPPPPPPPEPQPPLFVLLDCPNPNKCHCTQAEYDQVQKGLDLSCKVCGIHLTKDRVVPSGSDLATSATPEPKPLPQPETPFASYGSEDEDERLDRIEELKNFTSSNRNRMISLLTTKGKTS